LLGLVAKFVPRINRTKKMIVSQGGLAKVSQMKIKKTPKLIKYEEQRMYKSVSRFAQTRRESGIRAVDHRRWSKRPAENRPLTKLQRKQLGEGMPQEKEFRSQVNMAIGKLVADGHHSPFVQAEMLNWAGISTALNRKWTEELVLALHQRANEAEKKSSHRRRSRRLT